MAVCGWCYCQLLLLQTMVWCSWSIQSFGRRRTTTSYNIYAPPPIGSTRSARLQPSALVILPPNSPYSSPQRNICQTRLVLPLYRFIKCTRGARAIWLLFVSCLAESCGVFVVVAVHIVTYMHTSIHNCTRIQYLRDVMCTADKFAYFLPSVCVWMAFAKMHAQCGVYGVLGAMISSC